MIALPDAPLPWRLNTALGVSELVDANGEPVILSHDDGLSAPADAWAFILAAVNAYAFKSDRHTAAGVLVPRRPDLQMDAAFIGYLNECERRKMMPTIAALWPRLLAAALKADR
ncbi:hypothetical protein NKI15_06715 [Mesorhizobium sp. M0862]|uniref:hypothetical protein n=1 Tax=Mesorhizobium sp. M0862 TaxID=2957015 RepID=UPI0033362A63